MRKIFIGCISTADHRRFSRIEISHLRAKTAGSPDRNFECLLQTCGESRLLRRQMRRRIELRLSPSSRPKTRPPVRPRLLILANRRRYCIPRRSDMRGCEGRLSTASHVEPRVVREHEKSFALAFVEGDSDFGCKRPSRILSGEPTTFASTACIHIRAQAFPPAREAQPIKMISFSRGIQLARRNHSRSV